MIKALFYFFVYISRKCKVSLIISFTFVDTLKGMLYLSKTIDNYVILSIIEDENFYC